jgi:hypothetical protein
MKTISIGCLIFTSVFHIAAAKIPEKAPAVKYTGLYTNSPFTSKPAAPPDAPTANPLEDYTLAGIAPVPGGYRITIINKKNPEMKEVIEPGGSGQFKVVSVNRNPGKTLGTTVVLSSGSIQGTVAFEPDLITLKAAPATPEPQQGQLPPGITPAMAGQQGAPPNANAEAVRQPRPRIVPPPTTGAKQPGDNKKQQSGGQNNNSPQRTQYRR